MDFDSQLLPEVNIDNMMWSYHLSSLASKSFLKKKKKKMRKRAATMILLCGAWQKIKILAAACNSFALPCLLWMIMVPMQCFQLWIFCSFLCCPPKITYNCLFCEVMTNSSIQIVGNTEPSLSSSIWPKRKCMQAGQLSKLKLTKNY